MINHNDCDQPGEPQAGAPTCLEGRHTSHLLGLVPCTQSTAPSPVPLDITAKLLESCFPTSPFRTLEGEG